MSCKYTERGYQLFAVDAVFEQLAHKWSTMLVMATGTGKTWVYLKVSERFMKEHPGKRVMIFAHREELITQPAERWAADTGMRPLIDKADLKADEDFQEEFFSCEIDSRIVIATTQTLNSGKRCPHCTVDCHECEGTGKNSKPCEDCNGSGQVTCHTCEYENASDHGGECPDCEDTGETSCKECKGEGASAKKCKPCEGDGWVCVDDDCKHCFENFIRRFQKFAPEEFGLLICDESHHTVGDTYTRLIRYMRHRNPHIKLLGVTATPDRADEEELGQIYESVAYDYSLPQPILDGWLVPIDQQYIVVGELNLSNVRKTAGDLNKGDLEAEMMVEKVLHKVTTPLVEISCGLVPGTLDQLIEGNLIDRLPSMCLKHEPTLVHCASVAHAERMTEILNRYLPDSALCIVGTTDKTIRREGLKAFAEGKHQFLLSCGVFLEGTDLPNVSIVAMARPTMSRALYAQMLGRALRALAGLIDGIADAAERIRLILASHKPRALVLDFVGNSGRHKLVSSADILGAAFPADLVEGVKRKAAQSGVPVNIMEALKKAKEESEEQEKRRKEAAERKAEEDRKKREEAEKRRGIVASAEWSNRQVDPFDNYDRIPGRERVRGPNDASEKQEKLLRKNGRWREGMTSHQAHVAITRLFKEWDGAACTENMQKTLKKSGEDVNVNRKVGGIIISVLEARGWKNRDSKLTKDRWSIQRVYDKHGNVKFHGAITDPVAGKIVLDKRFKTQDEVREYYKDCIGI